MHAGRCCCLAGLTAVFLIGNWGLSRDALAQEPSGREASPRAGRGSSPSDSGAAKSRPVNRLARETSPYLLLHAHNPVDWYPWGPEALEVARREQKPIFLSIGYSSCFWCHVMEREVFENEEIAKYMNAHFINVKVDREERPDLDDIYMTAVQVYFQLSGSSQGGGWPLSMFLTPEGKPIAGGTYFPPKDMQGRPGFPTVLKTVHDLWTTKRPDIEKTADVMTAEVQRIMKPTVAVQPTVLDRRLVDAAVAGCLSQYDPEFGGLDFHPQQPGRPKFPVPSRLMLLQSQAGRPGSEAAVQACDHTLEAMASGGIYDHLGGGFHRYSTDRQWRVPHFEKMLYDNAQLAAVYADAFQRTSRKSYRQVAEETIHFILREMTDPAGGFYSALDAETDGVEGAHYVWSREEIQQRLGPDARLFSVAYGLDQPEFFEHGYVLLLPRSLAETAEQLRMPAMEVESRLVGLRKKLLSVREARPALLKDDKVLTSWNGLMISALARSGRILNRPEYTRVAEKCALFLASQLRNDQGRLQRSWRKGDARLNAYLDDYAFLIQGLLSLHETTQDVKWLHASRRLMDDQVELFWDTKNRGFFFTSGEHEALLARAKDAYDSVLPSGNSVSVRNLVRLSLLTGDDRYRDLAEQTLGVFAPAFERSPGSMPYMAIALQEYLAAFPSSAAAPAVADSPAGTPPTFAPSPTVPSTPAASAAPETLAALAVQPEDPTGKHKAHVSVYLGRDQLTPGGQTPVAFVFEISRGWHLNANPPRPGFVIPTSVKLGETSGVELVDVGYPPGHEFRIQGIEEAVSVYEGRVVVVGQLQTAADLAGSTSELTFAIRYQACNEQTCTQPQTVTLTAVVPVTAPGDQPRTINRALFSAEAAPQGRSPVR